VVGSRPDFGSQRRMLQADPSTVSLCYFVYILQSLGRWFDTTIEISLPRQHLLGVCSPSFYTGVFIGSENLFAVCTTWRSSLCVSTLQQGTRVGATVRVRRIGEPKEPEVLTQHLSGTPGSGVTRKDQPTVSSEADFWHYPWH
jgi:hypothetical protein